jgi:hypothetical protein
MFMPMPMGAQIPMPAPVQWISPPAARAGCPAGLEHLLDIADFKVVEELIPANRKLRQRL